MVNSSGLLRQIYSRTNTSCQAQEFGAGVKYVFSVRADYSVGAYVRSSSRCFTTTGCKNCMNLPLSEHYYPKKIQMLCWELVKEYTGLICHRQCHDGQNLLCFIATKFCCKIGKFIWSLGLIELGNINIVPHWWSSAKLLTYWEKTFKDCHDCPDQDGSNDLNNGAKSKNFPNQTSLRHPFQNVKPDPQWHAQWWIRDSIATLRQFQTGSESCKHYR